MRKKLKNTFRTLLRNKEGKVSYSQCGEDLIARFAFDAMGISRPTYLDIGANDPVALNNTYGFYSGNSFGVSIEPDPTLFGNIKAKRPKEVSLNIGIASRAQKARPFFVLSPSTLNTFSEEEAKRYEAGGSATIVDTIMIDIENINDVIARYFRGTAPDFVSIDVEGLDLEIVRSLDFGKYRPLMFCIETLTYEAESGGRKIPEIGAFLCEHGYFTYADTYINTLFMDEAAWISRRR